MNNVIEKIKNRRVLFITTKNIDYIRNVQEVRLIKENAKSVDLIFSKNRYYFFRVISVWAQICKTRMNCYDIVFVGFAPQLILPFWRKKFADKYIIIDFFISMYDTLVCDRKIFRNRGAVAKACHLMDEKTVKCADCVITDTKTHASYFINEFQGEQSKFVTIYLEADSSIYYPRLQNKPDELKEKFVVLYFGSILPLQGVEVVLAAARLLKEYSNIFFDIIGPVPEKYKKTTQNNVCFTDWLPQEKLAKRIADSDLCLAGHFSKDIDKAWRTIPGKVYIYEAMGKKMILGEGSANHELFSEDERHFFVNRGSSMELSNLIRRIANQ